MRRNRCEARGFLGIEQLEARELLASLNAIGSEMDATLNRFARTIVIPPALQQLPQTVQSSVVAEASDNFEATLDATYKRGAGYGAAMAQSGQVPKLAPGWSFTDQHGRPSGLVAEIAYDGTSKYTDSVTVSDGRTGFSELDTRFTGALTGTAQVAGGLHVHMALDVYATKDGVLSAKLSTDNIVALEGLKGSLDLRGRGAFGADADVTITSHGAISGVATMNVDNNGAGIKANPLLDLACNLDSVLTSNEAFSNGVTWGISSASRETGRGDLKVVAPVYHAPSALDVLRAAYKGVGAYRITLPGGINDAISGALSIQVPFTKGQTIAQEIGYPSLVPLLIDTINADKYGSYDDLAAAISRDKRFVVQLGGQPGADAFARGEYRPILDVQHIKASAGTSFTLAETPLGTYVLYPGITLSGNAGIYVDVDANVDAAVRIDSHGGGFREGTNASLDVKIEGALKGSLDVVGISKWSLLEADVKAGAYVGGTITATLGLPFDKDGNPVGAGVWYVGAAAAFNPKSATVGDYTRLDLGLDTGVEVSTKVKVLGLTVWKDSWSKDWQLAHATYPPKKHF